jgi:hypothetical protein
MFFTVEMYVLYFTASQPQQVLYLKIGTDRGHTAHCDSGLFLFGPRNVIEMMLTRFPAHDVITMQISLVRDAHLPDASHSIFRN